MVRVISQYQERIALVLFQQPQRRRSRYNLSKRKTRCVRDEGVPGCWCFFWRAIGGRHAIGDAGVVHGGLQEWSENGCKGAPSWLDDGRDRASEVIGRITSRTGIAGHGKK